MALVAGSQSKAASVPMVKNSYLEFVDKGHVMHQCSTQHLAEQRTDTCSDEKSICNESNFDQGLTSVWNVPTCDSLTSFLADAFSDSDGEDTCSQVESVGSQVRPDVLPCTSKLHTPNCCVLQSWDTRRLPAAPAMIVKNTLLEFVDEDLAKMLQQCGPMLRQRTDSCLNLGSWAKTLHSRVSLIDSELPTSYPWCHANANWDTDSDCPEESDTNPNSVEFSRSVDWDTDSDFPEEFEKSPNIDELSSGVHADDVKPVLSSNQSDDMLPFADAKGRAQNGSGLSGFTTLMIQNVPVKYSQARLVGELNRNGFRDRYDFFYLPQDTRAQQNRGFAFINFNCAEAADEFYRKYHDSHFLQFKTEQTLTISVADIQGFENNARARRFTRASLLHRGRTRPLFFKPLPEPCQSVDPSGFHTGVHVSLPMQCASMSCRHCGVSIRHTCNFCPFCGSPLLTQSS